MEKVERVNEVSEMYLFIIYEVDGKKYIEISAYTYEVDSEEGRWAVSEPSACNELLADFIRKYRDYKGDCTDYVTEMISRCIQFEDDANASGMVKIINSYLRGKNASLLDFKDITEDADCGYYVNYGRLVEKQVENQIENPADFLPEIYKMYDELHNKICNFVKAHQGEKGYIDTQSHECDGIYVAVYEGDDLVEKKVHAIKCDEDGDLLILCDDDVNGYHNQIVYSDEDIKNQDEDDCNSNWWLAGKGGDTMWAQTLFAIAEVIAEYV